MARTNAPRAVENSATGAKIERLEARASAEEKATIQHAADLEGRSLSEFIVTSTYEAAQEVIRTRDILTLSPRASRAFVEALLNPPAPSADLRVAFAAYRQRVVDGHITHVTQS